MGDAGRGSRSEVPSEVTGQLQTEGTVVTGCISVLDWMTARFQLRFIKPTYWANTSMKKITPKD